MDKSFNGDDSGSPHDVFLSYAREDVASAEKLCAVFEARGFRVFWDQDLRGGQIFSLELAAAIQAAAVTVVCWSPHAVNSAWVAKEAALAMEAGTLLPLKLSTCILPVAFAHLHTVDVDFSSLELSIPIAELMHRAAEIAGGRWPEPDVGTGWYENPLDAFGDGEQLTVVGLMTDIIASTTKKGAPYVRFSILTEGGPIACVQWDTDVFASTGSVIEAVGSVNRYREKRRLQVSRSKVQEPYRPDDQTRASISYLERYVASADRSGLNICELEHVLHLRSQEPVVTPMPGSYANLEVGKLTTEENAKLFRFLLEQRSTSLFVGYPLIRIAAEDVQPLAMMAVGIMRSARSNSRFVVRSLDATISWNQSAVKALGLDPSELPRPRPDRTGLDEIRAALDNYGLDHDVLKPDMLDGSRQGPVHNTAVLFQPGTSNATRSLRADYDDLSSWSSERIAASSLGPLLAAGRLPDADVVPRITFGPSIGQATLTQEEARQCSAKRRLTVVTGPPGTGKSQLIVNTAQAAVEAGQTVVIASTNNAAIEAVQEKARLDCGLTAILVGGSKAKDQTVLAQLAPFRSLDPDGSEETWSQEWDQLGERVRPVYDLADHRRTLEVQSERAKDRTAAILDRLAPATQAVIVADPDVVESLSVRAQAAQHAYSSCRNWRLIKRFWLRRAERAIRVELCQLLEIEPSSFTPEVAALLAQLVNEWAMIDDLDTSLGGFPPLMQLDAWLSENSSQRAAVSQARAGHVLGRRYASAPSSARQGMAAFERAVDSRKSQIPETGRVVRAALPAWATTLHSARRYFEMIPEDIDLVIIDEASQCHLSTAAPLLARARRAMIVGDPHQLPMVDTVDESERHLLGLASGLDPAFLKRLTGDATLYDLAAAASDEKPLFLDRHFRCHPHIAEFANDVFYDGRMVVCTTADDNEGGGIFWVDCHNGASTDGRVNEAEAERIVELVQELSSQGINDIGIIAPFVDQSALLKRRLAKAEADSGVTVGTVHTFQGSERSVIVFSPVLRPLAKPGRQRFVNDRHLVNVAVTRARHRFIVVGDRTAFEASTPIGRLATYAQAIN